MDQLGVMMHPLDDYKNSQRLVAAGASIVMPLPGAEQAGGHSHFANLSRAMSMLCTI
jgi:hypothetical protein